MVFKLIQYHTLSPLQQKHFRFTYNNIQINFFYYHYVVYLNYYYCMKDGKKKC